MNRIFRISILSFIVLCFTIVMADSQSLQKTISITVSLSNGFSLALSKGEVLGNLTVYSHIKLMRNGKIIYQDDSRTYELSTKMYPMVMPTGNNRYDIILEVNDNPNKSYLHRLFVVNDKVVKDDVLPTFVMKPCFLKGNSSLVFAGFWGYNEVWNDTLTAYNPILYYEVTKAGLLLDSTFTEQMNKKIYGAFYGFEYNHDKPQHIRCLERHSAEISRIKSKCKCNCR